MKNDEGLKREIEFESRLRTLMSEYGFSLRGIIALIEPQRAKPESKAIVSTPRRERVLKVYKKPQTGEVVETKGGNHKVLKAWKGKFGAETVESWRQ